MKEGQNFCGGGRHFPYLLVLVEVEVLALEDDPALGPRGPQHALALPLLPQPPLTLPVPQVLTWDPPVGTYKMHGEYYRVEKYKFENYMFIIFHIFIYASFVFTPAQSDITTAARYLRTWFNNDIIACDIHMHLRHHITGCGVYYLLLIEFSLLFGQHVSKR